MLECRERNGNKHIVSDNELNAFAWAGYYTNCSTILINGKSYEVVHVTDSEIEFKDGTRIPRSIANIETVTIISTKVNPLFFFFILNSTSFLIP